jgi:hypothetical protein
MTFKRFGIVAGLTGMMWIMVGAEPAPSGSAQGEPSGGYEVHDKRRPQPPLVEPGTFSSQEKPGTPPSDAVVLFDGKDLSRWSSAKGGGGEAPWKVENGEMVIAPRTGPIQTKDQWGDQQLHIEWMEPKGTEGKSQHRGNSGVFLMGLFELQVLDSYQSETYADGMAGALYGMHPPLANAARPQGEWQVYDVIFRAPKYDGDKLVEPAYMTVFLNGVVVQDHANLLGPSSHKALVKYPDKPLPSKGPLQLQDHGNPVHFRNIWVRPLAVNPPTPTAPAGDNYYGKEEEEQQRAKKKS